MNFTIENGTLTAATQIPSPNFNARPDGTVVRAVVIHNISLPPAKFGLKDRLGNHYVTSLFTNQLDWEEHPYFKAIEGTEVSAHLFIERDGTVNQYVNFNDRAWHAGKSHYLGRSNCNDFSIGIELEGTDDSPFSDAQYRTLSAVLAAIHTAYPATRRQLTGHSDIAPIRKTDPGACFDWQRLRQELSVLMRQNNA